MKREKKYATTKKCKIKCENKNTSLIPEIVDRHLFGQIVERIDEFNATAAKREVDDDENRWRHGRQRRQSIPHADGWRLSADAWWV